MIFLFLIWFFIVAVLTYQPEKEVKMKQLSIPINGKSKYYILPQLPHSTRIGINLEGAFLKEKFNNRTEYYLSVYLQSIPSREMNDVSDWGPNKELKNMTDPIFIPVSNPELFDFSVSVKKSHLMYVKEDDLDNLKEHKGFIRLVLKSNFYRVMPLKLKYDYAPVNIDVGVIYAAFALIFLYGLIIWEVSIA